MSNIFILISYYIALNRIKMTILNVFIGLY